MAYCGKCGTKLEQDDKFCPKCGEPVDDIEDVEGVEEVDDQEGQEEQAEKKKKKVIAIFAITIIFILGFIVLYNNKKADNITEQEKTEKTVRQGNPQSQNGFENKNVEPRGNSEESSYNEEYKQKTIDYENQLVEIANEIERQCNQFAALSSGNVDLMTYGRMQIALTNNVYDLEKKAEKIFDELIKLAKQSGNESAVSVITAYRRKFLSDAQRMLHSVRDEVNDY